MEAKRINGIKTLYNKRNSDLVSINISILSGSSSETSSTKGIAHFIEHMLFEGTKNRTCEQLTSEIEKYGGELNAYTSTERTNYFIKIHKKHAKKGFEILGDMICNPLFDTKSIKKEKNVVLGEIKMVNDQPRHYQWILLQKNLLPGKYSWPTYGTIKTVKNLSQKDLLSFYSKHYVKNNIIITIVGECKDFKKYIKENFTNLSSGKKINHEIVPIKNKKKIYKEKKKLELQYLVIGYQTVSRKNKDSYVLDLIHAILAKGQSGRLFIEIRTKRGLGYELGIYHNLSSKFGYFAFYANAEKSKIKTIEEIFFQEIKALTNPDTISNELIKDAKTHIEGNIALKNEDSEEEADLISFFQESGENLKEYCTKINKITKKDIAIVVRKYLNNRYTKIVIE